MGTAGTNAMASEKLRSLEVRFPFVVVCFSAMFCDSLRPVYSLVGGCSMASWYILWLGCPFSFSV